MMLPKTENQSLRERLAWAEGELRRIDVETAKAAIERREELAKEEERKAAAAQAAREAEALEGHRIAAWQNYRVDQCYEASDPNAAFVALMNRDLNADIPADVWPPGRSPDEFRTIPVPAAPPDPKLNDTRLGQMFAKKGIAL